MSAMQLGLLVVGGAVLLSMAFYNVWLTRRSQPKLPTSPESSNESELKQEPTMDARDLDGPDFLVPLVEKKPQLDSLIDSLVSITLESAVSGDAVLAALPSTRRVGSKPFALEALNVSSQHWEQPVPGQRYSQLQAGLQLANRTGPINDIEFSEFVMKTQSFCDALNGTPDFPDMHVEVARARELDHFASAHDAQIGFVLRAKRVAWSATYLQQIAVQHGFAVGPIAGRMVLPASVAGRAPVLVLSFDTQAALADDPAQSALREVFLLLDVAQVDRAERGFDRMCQTAQALAAAIDGVVTDDQGVTVSPQAMELIAAELEQLYDRLDGREFSAGSALARRLFS